MKKPLIILTCIIISILIVSALYIFFDGRGAYDERNISHIISYEANGAECIQSDVHYNNNKECYLGNVSRNENEQEILTLSELLYDFDFMIQMMEYTFPFFGVAERRHGIDLRKLAMDTRSLIEGYPYSAKMLAEEMGLDFEHLPVLNEQLFWWLVMANFFSHIPRGFAHFDMLSAASEFLLMTNVNFYYHDRSCTQSASVFRAADINSILQHSAAGMFYTNQINTLLSLIESPTPFSQAFLGDDFDADLLNAALSLPPTQVVTTNILAEGKIAYVRIPSFYMPDLREFDQNRNILMEFYKKIQDYEHLIIDIRDNTGGNQGIGNMLTIYALWPDSDNVPDMPFYALFGDGDFGCAMADFVINRITQRGQLDAGYQTGADGLFMLTDIPESFMPYINEFDVEGLAYGIRLYTNPINYGSRLFRRNTPHIPFHGQIWILINENNASAAATFARHVRYMDFAILVGEQVGGAETLGYFLLTLPNTGIIVKWDAAYLTDVYGRSFEEFPTLPHYLNREGYDALETVLQIIKENW